MQAARPGHQLHHRRRPRRNAAGHARRRPAHRPLRGARTPRRPVRRLDPERLNAYAVRALTRRPHSIQELRQKLAARALDPAGIEPLLTRLTERGWLDDRRFARDYARTRALNRRLGRYRIARELRRKGVDAEWIEAALAEVFPAEKDERVLVRKRIQKRLARTAGPPYPEKLLRSLYASLLRAGFSSAIIRSELLGRARGKLLDEFAPDEGEDA